MRKKTSKIWDIPLEELKTVVSDCDSVQKILKHFGINSQGGMTRTLKKRLDVEGIDHTHIPNGVSSNKGRRFDEEFRRPKRLLSDVLVKNSDYARAPLRRRLLKERILKNECAICEMGSTWNDKPISMVLDHINGINNDNRLENLRFVCPNCNSQLDTFSGRNTKKARKQIAS